MCSFYHAEIPPWLLRHLPPCHAEPYPLCHASLGEEAHEAGRYAAMLRASFAMVAQDKAQQDKWEGQDKWGTHKQLLCYSPVYVS